MFGERHKNKSKLIRAIKKIDNFTFKQQNLLKLNTSKKKFQIMTIN